MIGRSMKTSDDFHSRSSASRSLCGQRSFMLDYRTTRRDRLYGNVEEFPLDK